MAPCLTARVSGPSTQTRLVAHEQVAAHQVAGGQVLVTGDGDQGQSQAVGHVLQEAGLAAAGGALEHDRHLERVRLLEQLDLVAGGAVVRLGLDAVVLDRELFAAVRMSGSMQRPLCSMLGQERQATGKYAHA